MPFSCKAVNFGSTTFNSSVDFNNVRFNRDVDFMGSIFNNYSSFHNAIFNNSLNIGHSYFNKSVLFDGVKFYGPVSFYWTSFNSSVDFWGTIFNSSADFRNANFGSVRFNRAKFNNSSTFNKAKFYGTADFTWTGFKSSSDFGEATFYSSAKFEANFNGPVNLWGANFNCSAELVPPGIVGSKNIYADGKTCELFRKAYNSEARYTDADNIYFNYRVRSMGNKNLLSQLPDEISLHTCGFGTKLHSTLFWIVVIIFVFALIYKWGGWKTPGIYRSSEEAKEEKSKVSFLECLGFSINTFTRLGSPNWRQRDNFWIAVTIEGLLGWIMLGIFLATLMHLLIRP